jgi:hypothetical protein
LKDNVSPPSIDDSGRLRDQETPADFTPPARRAGIGRGEHTACAPGGDEFRIGLFLFQRNVAVPRLTVSKSCVSTAGQSGFAAFCPT